MWSSCEQGFFKNPRKVIHIWSTKSRFHLLLYKSDLFAKWIIICRQIYTSNKIIEIKIWYLYIRKGFKDINTPNEFTAHSLTVFFWYLWYSISFVCAGIWSIWLYLILSDKIFIESFWLTYTCHKRYMFQTPKDSVRYDTTDIFLFIYVQL